jgi:hypothetical protein
VREGFRGRFRNGSGSVVQGTDRWRALRFRAYAARRHLLGAALVAGVVALALVGYVLGSSQTVALDSAQQAGAAAGARKGAAVGEREGYTAGFEIGRRNAYNAAYREAFKAAYIGEFREADLPLPARVVVRRP